MFSLIQHRTLDGSETKPPHEVPISLFILQDTPQYYDNSPMLCDLNVVWPKDAPEGSIPGSVSKTLTILQDLGYTTVAINVLLKGKIPSGFKCPFDCTQIQANFEKLKILSRVTYILDSSAQNLTSLLSQFDIIAVRPLSEKAFQSAMTLEIDLISFDFTTRLPFFIRNKTACSVVEKGIKFEICYGPSTTSHEGRRHVITNSGSVIRACRGRGIVASSEAKGPLACRGPYDVTNLVTTWGLDHMRARDSVGKTAESVVRKAYLRTHSYKQVVAIPAERATSVSSTTTKKRESTGEPAAVRNKKKTKTRPV